MMTTCALGNHRRPDEVRPESEILGRSHTIVVELRRLVEEACESQTLVSPIAILERNRVADEELLTAVRGFGEPFGERLLRFSLVGDGKIDSCHASLPNRFASNRLRNVLEPLPRTVRLASS